MGVGRRGAATPSQQNFQGNTEDYEEDKIFGESGSWCFVPQNACSGAIETPSTQPSNETWHWL
jgi:hypothetical protein